MPPRRRVITEIARDRFAAGWRLALDTVAHHPALPDRPVILPRPPSDPADADDAIRVDIVRPRDLVALSVAFTGCELVGGGDEPPVVRPAGDDPARLFVDHAFQHGFEEAIYEVEAPEPNDDGSQPDPVEGPEVDDSPITAPVVFRPARSSRLVFDIEPDDEVEFSTSGILAAMRRLTLVVHPLAKPGAAAQRGRIEPGGGFVLEPPFIHIGDGLILQLFGDGPVIRTATQAFLRDHPAPDTASLAGRRDLRRNVARARAELARGTPRIAARTRIPDDSIFRPGGGLVPDLPDISRARRTLSRPPTLGETAIEAPYRLVVSPSVEARFAHATRPVPADDDVLAVELWHSRLAHQPAEDGQPPDERNDNPRRIVRAVWARDRDWVGDDWQDGSNESSAGFPLSHVVDDSDTRGPGVRGSLDRFDRHMLVRQSAETWAGADDPLQPVPVAARSLWLSGLGAWLDLHGAWTTMPYSEVGLQSILAWDHVAPLGRDQYVRVVYPGFLYPFGPQTALVKVTERKMKTATNSVAGLYQRMFLVIGERRRTYGQRGFPFLHADITPLVSPVLDPPSGAEQVSFFWPRVAGQRFTFTIDTHDQQGRPVRLHTPLIWVSEAFSSAADHRQQVVEDYRDDPDSQVPLDGQSVAYVPAADDGSDTKLESRAIKLDGSATLGDATPEMAAASVVIPAVQRISGTDAMWMSYRDEYVANDFGAGDVGEVWGRINVAGEVDLEDHVPTSPLPGMRFGGSAGGAGSDKAGGFLAPELPIRGLSRSDGPIGDITSAVSNSFDPVEYLKGMTPRLFGLFDLWDLIPDDLLADLAMPSIVTETLGRIDQFTRDVETAVAEANAAVAEADKLVARAADKSAELQARAQQAQDAAEQVVADAEDLVDEVADMLDAIADLDLEDIEAQADPTFQSVRDLATGLRDLAGLLPPQARTRLEQVADALVQVADAEDLVDDLFAFVRLLDPANLAEGFSFEWTLQLREFPADFPIFTLDDPGATDHLVLAVRGRLPASGAPEVTASAELRDFSLTLFGTEPLMRVPFDHMFFKAGSTGKPEVDVVLGDLEFLGFLSFVETVKDLIPFDGFSDPPYLEVSPSGATAGFTLELPSLAIGVFNLSNMSLGADVNVPFLGNVVTVGFNFCTRERPFTLAVMCLGGGGWFLIRLSPNGLEVLELGLEATASLSVDFGVASGSISAAVGIYIRLEGETGSLTGYFRLRGEVDVLGLISASIELYMELVYAFDTGKMIGRAKITVEVEVLFFSASVTIEAERQLAGSNGDPSFREVLGAEDGTSQAWQTYCAAFAPEG